MPELPEVEITRRGIEPLVRGRKLTALVVRNARLRWRVRPDLARRLVGRRVERVLRRGKYLVLECASGSILLHLGMSGSLRVVDPHSAAGVHEHLDLVFGDVALRLRDPRRFAALLWTPRAGGRHPLLERLGVEPLEETFDGEFLHRVTRRRRATIKQVLMNARIVAGIGNIYANESLFRAGIRPGRAAGRLTRAQCARLAEAVRATLLAAIAAGGSSLRDFAHADGALGYFQQQYFVYDRAGLPCRACGTTVRRVTIGQRSSFYCPRCQT